MATNRIKEFVRQNQRPRRSEPLMPWLSKELMTKFKSCLYLSVLLYPSLPGRLLEIEKNCFEKV